MLGSGSPEIPVETEMNEQEQLNIAHYFLGARLEEGLGDRIAVRTDDRSYTYAEVDLLSRRVAARLQQQGIRPEERVLVALPDGIEMVAAIFGILKLGAIVVMINPDLETDSFRYFFEYTRARGLVTSDASRLRINPAAESSPHLMATLNSDTEANLFDPSFTGSAADSSESFVTFPSHADDPAIWLFSGGTTGQPKAVVQSHQSFRNTTECYAHHVLGYTQDDITVSVPKLYFGYATGSNLFFPFSVGASTVLFPERCTAERLFDTIERHRPTILINVPTMIGKLLSDPSAKSRDLSSLRVATSAGEALPEELHKRWDQAFGTEILDGLGTAEMWHVFLSNHLGDVKPGTLGKPVHGFDVRVRDDEGNDLKPDEVGCLWVRGDSRALQYWQQPEKSRQAFRGEWFVSGDMVRCDADGYFTYCGRGDDMLKIGGKWLAPQEVENCLISHPEIAEVAVVAVPDDTGLEKPWAFVRPTSKLPADSTALQDELRNFALERLEPYKAPRHVVLLEEFPRTHLGKIDRGSLRREHG